MLATFYAKALDADLPRPILGDRFAKEIVDRIDYDWKRTAITAANSPSVTTRSAHFDNWVRQFLAVTPEAVVLHLGCGLDARFFRLDPGPGVEWYDVDYPDVADLRRQLYPPRDHYHVLAASVTDPGWFAELPSGRPTLMIGEGLTMYLTKEDGVALLRRVVEHAPSGELQFDAFNRLGIKAQWTNAVVRRAGATLSWGIDGPDDIIEAVPGVRLLAWASPFDDPVFQDIAWYYRVMAKVMSAVAGPSLHGAVPPLRLLSADTQDGLAPSPLSPTLRPMATGHARRPTPTAVPECPGRRAPQRNSCAHRDDPPRRSRAAARRRRRCAPLARGRDRPWLRRRHRSTSLPHPPATGRSPTVPVGRGRVARSCRRMAVDRLRRPAPPIRVFESSRGVRRDIPQWCCWGCRTASTWPHLPVVVTTSLCLGSDNCGRRTGSLTQPSTGCRARVAVVAHRRMRLTTASGRGHPPTPTAAREFLGRRTQLRI